MHTSPTSGPWPRRAFASLTIGLLAACTVPDGPATRDGIFDPYEARNRRIHENSKKIDKTLIRPVAVAYAQVMPPPGQEMVNNFASNLSVPRAVVNQILQFDLEGALNNTVRFGLNSTLGFAGVFDVAAEFGLNEDEADFGQTLAIWGVPEGAYMELPLVGPSTERHTAGRVVDFIIDPLNAIPKPEGYYLTGVKVIARVGQRGRFVETVDSVLHDSADSYAQSRLLYLQNRRFELGQSTPPTAEDDAAEIDPYLLLYGE